MADLLAACMSKKTPDQCKDAGLALTLLLLLLLLTSKKFILLFPALGVLLVTMTGPRLLQPVAMVWFGLSELMSLVMGKIVLTIIFFLIITPMGLLRKGAGRDAMGIRAWKSSTASVFTVRDHPYSPADLEKPY